MSKVTIAAYSIQVKVRNKPEYRNFGDVIPSKDFITFMGEFFDEFQKNAATNETTKQLFRITPGKMKKNNREFSGIIETGEYGYESNIIDAVSQKRNYKRKTTDAEMLPFYFLTSMPKDKNIGFVLLQRFSLYGIAKIFQNNLQSYINGKIPDIIVEFKPVVSQTLLQKIIQNGDVKKVTFTSFEIPKDLAKYYQTGKNDTKLGRVEYSLIAQKNSSLKIGDRLNKMLFGAGTVNKLIQMDRFPYENTKIVIQNGNDKRTFEIGEDMKIRAYYDLTDLVTIGKDGHPEYDSLHKEAKKIQKEVESLLEPAKVRDAG